MSPVNCPSSTSISVSIIIPAYNAERSIATLVHAIEQQTMPVHEIIVVDDGSTDKTRECAVLPNVRYAWQSNSGPAVARNHGAELARGEILLFFDSDLAPHADCIKNMVTPFTDPLIAATQGVTKTSQTGLIARYCQADIEYKQQQCCRQKYVDSIAAGVFAIRRDVFKAYGGFCVEFQMAAAEDTDLSYRLAADGKRILFCTDAIAYHPQPDRLYTYIRLKYFRGYWRALLYKRHPTKVLKDSYTPLYLKIQVAIALTSPLWLPTLYYFAKARGMLLVLLLAATTIFPSMAYISRSAGLGVAMITPLMQLASSCSLAAGLVAGGARTLFK